MAVARAAAASGLVASVSTNAGEREIVSGQRAPGAAFASWKVPQTRRGGGRGVHCVSGFFSSGVDCIAARPCNICVGLQPIACVSSVNEVAVDSMPAAMASATKLDVSPVLGEEVTTLEPPASPAPEATISAFMADVANLVKLVDSRDIVELELKHKDYEIVIRKKEALPPPPQVTFPGPHVMAHTPFPGYAAPPPPAPPASAAPAAEPSAPVAPAAPAPPQYPPMLSPMAGMFYRSPAPGEGAFVQIGDKVTKGQVLCIVEAMKLMNEIEADQTGVIVEIVAKDGSPVAIESVSPPDTAFYNQALKGVESLVRVNLTHVKVVRV